MKAYAAVVWIVTAVCCSFEMYSMTASYMKYPTSTKLSIKHADIVRIPSVVSCVNTKWNGSNFVRIL